jgi:transaldolase
LAGITTNPTIFQKAVTGSDLYDDQLRDLAIRGVDIGEALRAITTYDVRWACDVLRPVYDATDGVDGRVSIEVDPRIAHDTAKTVAEARALWWLVDRPNLFIKVPATVEGLPAISQLLAEGISVNVTLIFSLQRYAAVMEAFLDGVERARVAGKDLSRIGSVASFFVSRVDSEVDKRLDKIGSEEAKQLRGKAAIANAQLAYEAYEAVFSSERWKTLEAAGARPQRPLWASTGVKDPQYDDTQYVVQLVAPGTVNTMPQARSRRSPTTVSSPATACARPTPPHERSSADSTRSASATTRSSTCSRSRASRSSTRRGASSSTRCSPSSNGSPPNRRPTRPTRRQPRSEHADPGHRGRRGRRRRTARPGHAEPAARPPGSTAPPDRRPVRTGHLRCHG